MPETQRHVTYFAFPLDSLVQLNSKPPSLWRVAGQRVTYRWLHGETIEYAIKDPRNDFTDPVWVEQRALSLSTLAQEETLRG